jgi:hypothetical protein
MCRPGRVRIDREESELQIKPWHATAGRQWQLLGGLGHEQERRWRAACVREKEEHGMTRRGVQAHLASS